MSLADTGFPDLPKWDLFHFFRDDEDLLKLDKQMIIHSVEQLLDAFRHVFYLKLKKRKKSLTLRIILVNPK